MRIVRHPNIVELKAFYYSNGDRVCVLLGVLPPDRLSVPRSPWADRAPDLPSK